MGGEVTTIVYRDGIMCGDTAVFDRGTYCGRAKKVFRAPDGSIGGAAGALSVVARFGQWVEGGAEGIPPSIPPSDDSECLLVRPDGRVWWIGPDCEPTELIGDYFAAGSGFKIAMGALAMGATAQQALEICADFDNSTRRPINTQSLLP